MPEVEIQLEPKDIQRVRRINLALKQAQIIWDDSMKLILIDYVEGADVTDKRVGLIAMDFKTGKMKINIDGGNQDGNIRNQPDGGTIA